MELGIQGLGEVSPKGKHSKLSMEGSPIEWQFSGPELKSHRVSSNG
jgi:hypothetical protein